ncbi:hypothetical protein [Aristophania vespae]|uniref:hypothetical protein n=1 Tax=Aristophania vespae TaxID=2697033 RepID=UPI002351AB8C|nr:hypothetical protein [Aristophania vespae]UMM64214.1 hypothetical protein DM15PD_12150 [Aristophania vespae]
MSKPLIFKICAALLGVASFSLSHVSFADSAPTFGDVKKKPTLDQLYRSSQLVHKYADFSMFHYVPKGDDVVEQPERSRLLFRTKHGSPDGYAERKGEVIFYYNAAGKLIRVQKLSGES